MKRLYEGQTIDRFFCDMPYVTYSDFEFVGCTFASICISSGKAPGTRGFARCITLRNCCYIESGGLHYAIVEDTLVDGLQTRGILLTWAMAFKRVTLRGRVGRIMITDGPSPGLCTSPIQQRSWEIANAEYYRSVDWALDISQAEFVDCDIRGIPARLIRRDPETQAVVTREKALSGEWKKLDLERTHWQIAIEMMLAGDSSDIVLVAPKRARNFKNLLEGIKLLREAGVAEPD